VRYNNNDDTPTNKSYPSHTQDYIKATLNTPDCLDVDKLAQKVVWVLLCLYGYIVIVICIIHLQLRLITCPECVRRESKGLVFSSGNSGGSSPFPRQYLCSRLCPILFDTDSSSSSY